MSGTRKGPLDAGNGPLGGRDGTFGGRWAV
jgi:hypothetical protein